MDRMRFDWIIDGLREDELTEWETEFIESLKERMETVGDLTDKQEDKLEKIFKQRAR
jgi:hypothetical protein